MGYVGNWNNLREKIALTKERIHNKKERGEKRVSKNIVLNDAAKNRTRISLVEQRRKDIFYIRLFLIVLIAFLFTLCMYYL